MGLEGAGPTQSCREDLGLARGLAPARAVIKNTLVFQGLCQYS